MGFVKKVNQDILNIFQRSAQKINNKLNYHYYLQYKILELATKYQFIAGREFLIPNYRGDNRNGILDIAWIRPSNNKIMAIFEIDSSLRKKSIEKLIYIFDIPYRFWIFYGNRDKYEVDTSLKQNDPNDFINLIIYDKLFFNS